LVVLKVSVRCLSLWRNWFYARNDHGRGEVLLALGIQLCLPDTLRDSAYTLEIVNEEVSHGEVVEFGWHIGVSGTVTHVTQDLDVEHERIKKIE